jgi:hypothetical protein
MATFITSKAVGQTITIGAQTSTGYWKYNHDGTDSGVFSSSPQTITVANVNGEFTIISCLSDGTVSGDITLLDLSYDQITSFDGTGLTGLTDLRLNNNSLTSLDNFIFPASLTQLVLSSNQLTSFDGTDLVNLTQLFLNKNGLISLDNFIFPASLTHLNLDENQLTSFDGTGLSSLTSLNLTDNPLTTFIGGDMGLITGLDFNSTDKDSWDITTLTSFDGTGLSSLTSLNLTDNPLTTFIGGDMGLITELDFNSSSRGSWDITTLESIDITGMDNLQYLYVENNTSINNASVNNSLLAKLAANELVNDWDSGDFFTEGGRTSAGTTDYDYLIANDWVVQGAYIPLPPTFITSKAVDEDITINVQTSTEYWKYNHDGTDSSVFDQNSGSQTITVTNANGEFTIISCDDKGTVSGYITSLELAENQLTSFDGTDLVNLTQLFLNNNGLISLDNFIFPASLTHLNLDENQLTDFDGTDLTSLLELDLSGNGLTTIEGFIFPTSLTNLQLGTSKNNSNYLTSVDLSVLVNLTDLYLDGNGLTTLDISNMDYLQILYVSNNLLTPSVNNTLLAQLAANELANGWTYGEFYTTGGRTSDGTTDYNYLINEGWTIEGADLLVARKLRVRGINQQN